MNPDTCPPSEQAPSDPRPPYIRRMVELALILKSGQATMRDAHELIDAVLEHWGPKP